MYYLNSFELFKLCVYQVGTKIPLHESRASTMHTCMNAVHRVNYSGGRSDQFKLKIYSLPSVRDKHTTCTP